MNLILRGLMIFQKRAWISLSQGRVLTSPSISLSISPSIKSHMIISKMIFISRCLLQVIRSLVIFNHQVSRNRKPKYKYLLTQASRRKFCLTWFVRLSINLVKYLFLSLKILHREHLSLWTKFYHQKQTSVGLIPRRPKTYLNQL